jgi:uncharacterized protein (TIGR02246 family)
MAMKKKNKIAKLPTAGMFVLSAGLIAGAIHSAAAARHDSEVQEIQANEARWNHEFESRDLEKMAAHYADDATVIAPGMPAFRGKQAIRAMLQAMVGDASLSLKFKIVRVQIAKSGDVGWSEGSYTMTMTDPETKLPVTSGGSYVTVYRKQGGEWKAVSDIASAGPASAEQPSKEKNHER